MGTYTTKCRSSGAKQIPQVVEWFYHFSLVEFTLNNFYCLLATFYFLV